MTDGDKRPDRPPTGPAPAASDAAPAPADAAPAPADAAPELLPVAADD